MKDNSNGAVQISFNLQKDLAKAGKKIKGG